jgi:1,2-dihydroxy-3-keto-5-methylthiopentene dioxygenase
VLRRHGLYTWGETIADAERHVEILEFLFETLGRMGDRPRVRRSTETRVRTSRGASGRERSLPRERGTEDNAMALVHIPEEHRTIRGVADVAAFLASHGIEYERTTPDVPVAADAPAAEILAAYASKIADLNARGGYVAADVIDVHPDTPNLDTMLEKFKSEHWHDEDEVRFIIEGHGLFHIHPEGGPVFSIEVGAGDLIRVPKGTHHWFDLCGGRRIRAIRLFQDPSGWTPHYTHSGVDQGFQPICFGPAYFPAIRPAAGM